MRILSVLIITAAILCSCFMYFNTVSVRDGIAEMNDKIAAEAVTLETYRQNNDTIRDKISAAQNELAELRKKVENEENYSYFRTHRGAFLTFDDGPNDNTGAILDILKENNAKGTFFLIASQINSESRRALVKRIADEGHAVGIHCTDHEYDKIYESEKSFFDDLYAARDAIKDACGVTPTVMRFPGGSSTAKSYFTKKDPDLFLTVVKRLYDEGYEIEDWTVDTNDYSSSATVDKMLKEVNTNITARTKDSATYKTVVVLMHNKNVTVEALPKIIETFKKNEFEFHTLEVGHYARTQYDYTAMLKEFAS